MYFSRNEFQNVKYFLARLTDYRMFHDKAEKFALYAYTRALTFKPEKVWMRVSDKIFCFFETKFYVFDELEIPSQQNAIPNMVTSIGKHWHSHFEFAPTNGGLTFDLAIINTEIHGKLFQNISWKYGLLCAIIENILYNFIYSPFIRTKTDFMVLWICLCIKMEIR